MCVVINDFSDSIINNYNTKSEVLKKITNYIVQIPTQVNWLSKLKHKSEQY